VRILSLKFMKLNKIASYNGGTKVTFVRFCSSLAHEILCRGHELLSEIFKSSERDTMSWERDN
jgi:hypothetical protein